MAKDTITFERAAQKPKPKRKKAARAKVSKPKYVNVVTNEYAYNSLLTNEMINTLYGERIPDDPEEQSKFWKEKYDSLSRRNNSLQQQIDLLTSIINNAMTRSCGGS